MNKMKFFLKGFLTLSACLAFEAEAQSPVACHQESGSMEPAFTCSASDVGGLCSGAYYKQITFKTPFSAPPEVLVTPALLSGNAGCVGYGTDKIYCLPQEVTKTGFKMICSGSPAGGNCGAYNGYLSPGYANWIAVDSSTKGCTSESGHLKQIRGCPSGVGGLCSTAFSERVTFSKSYKTAPHVLLAPENVSDQGGCVGGSTDTVYCTPKDISTSGFTLQCAGSPYQSCGAYEGYFSTAQAGYIVREGSASCQVQSDHMIETDTCAGSLVGTGLCSGVFYKDVTFPKAFKTAPHVIVSPEHVTSSGSPCALNATDQYRCQVQNVTTTGFRAVCSGSPEGTACGSGYDGYITKAKFGYMAVDGTCNASQCQDGIDNDGDGLVDGQDPGCSSDDDDNEGDGTSQCQDGIDNDGDGAKDFPADFSCSSPQDNDETNPKAQCQDGLDNDNDGLVDLLDPGCSSNQDNNEGDASSQCQDGVDNDGDGAVDYPADFSCSSPQDNDETNPKSQCQDGLDNDGDGLVDMLDPGCSSPQDNNEGDKTSQCQDGIDNDGDGAVDYPADFSCSSPQDTDEANPKSQCQDGIDNDSDGKVDSADPGCSGNQDNSEDSDGDGCTQTSTASIKGEMDDIAVKLADLTKQAADLLSKNAKAIGKTSAGIAAVKTDAQRAKTKANRFVQRARELLIEFPEVSRFCPTANVLCKTVDRSPTIRALETLYSQQLSATKRITARSYFNKTGSTLQTRTNAIVVQAKSTFAAGNVSLAKLPALATECK